MDHPNFSTYFPCLDHFLLNYNLQMDLDHIHQQMRYHEGKDAFWTFFETQNMPQIEPELGANLPLNAWETMKKFKDGSTAVHTILVLINTFRDSIVQKQCSPEEQNILKWACLFHDLAKRGRPVFEGRDHVHPFMGGRVALMLFKEYGFFKIQGEEQEVAFSWLLDLIEQSVQTYEEATGHKGSKRKCPAVHSHHNLQHIFQLLWKKDSVLAHVAPRGSFVDQVLRLVMFHQSLLLTRKHDPMVQLKSEERGLYCDPKFYKLALPLMLGDHLAYSMFKKDLHNEMFRNEAVLCTAFMIAEWRHYQQLLDEGQPVPEAISEFMKDWKESAKKEEVEAAAPLDCELVLSQQMELEGMVSALKQGKSDL